MKLIYIFLFFLLYSCKSSNQLVVSDLNVIGKVKEIHVCKSCPDGGFIYIVELTPYEKIKYITDEKYKIGDFIFFKTIISQIK